MLGVSRGNAGNLSNIHNSESGGGLNMDGVNIQIQDKAGVWRTVHTTNNNSQQILSGMKSIQSRYPDVRVRTVGSDGRLIDML